MGVGGARFEQRVKPWNKKSKKKGLCWGRKTKREMRKTDLSAVIAGGGGGGGA